MTGAAWSMFCLGAGLLADWSIIGTWPWTELRMRRFDVVVLASGYRTALSQRSYLPSFGTRFAQKGLWRTKFL